MKKILFILSFFISLSALSQNTKVNNLVQYNVLDYGAIADSSTDCQPSFQRVVSAIVASTSKKGNVYIPAGVYKFSSTVIIPQGVRISWQGAGSTHDTIISPSTVSQGYGITKMVTSSATIDLFRDSSVGATYSDMDFQNVSATMPTAGAAINAIGTLFRGSNMSIQDFFYGLEMQNTTDPSLDNVNFRDCVQYGYYSFNSWNSDIGDDAISNCWFRNYTRRTVAQIMKRGSGGMKIVNCKWNAGGQYIGDCIRDSVPSSTYSTGDLMISNCSFENYVGYALNMAVIGSGSVRRNIEIVGGNMSSLRGGDGIKLYNSGGTLRDITITGVAITDCVNGIIATGVDNIHISGVANTATTPYTFTSCVNVFYDRAVATALLDGLMPKEAVTAFYQLGGTPLIGPVVVQDDFNRANTSNIIGSTPAPNSAGNWVDVFLPSTVFLGIVSNQLTCASSGTSAVHTSTGGLTNYDVSVVLPTATITGSGAIILLGSYLNPTNWLQLQVSSSGALNIYTQIAGSFVSIYSTTVSLANGDTLHLRTLNGTAYAIKNSTVLGSGTYSLASVTGTEAGIYYFNNTATVMDHFTVTSVTGTSNGWGVAHDGTITGDGTPINPLSASGAGVSVVGTFAGSSHVNGASISGNTITFSPSDGTNPGMVTTGTQTIAGAKTFTAGTTTIANNQNAATGLFITNTTPGTGSTALFRLTSDTYLNQLQQFSSTTTAYGALVANSSNWYSNSTHLVFMDDNAAPNMDFALGSGGVAKTYFMTPTAFSPGVTNTNDLGTSSLAWKTLYYTHTVAGTTSSGIGAGTGAGTSPTITIAGNDEAGVLTVVTGTGPAGSNATIATMTYNGGTGYNYPTGSVVELSPANAAASAIWPTGALPFAVGTTNTWVLTSGVTALAASTTYKIAYHIRGY